MPRPLALATCAQFPRLAEDDQRLVRALAAAGVDARPAVWDESEVDWSRFSAVLLRCTWDYHLKFSAFERWLAQLESRRVPLFNPLATVRGNLRKTYLQRVPGVVPTEWLAADQEADLDAVLSARGWDEAVVKPVVSASAHLTRRVRRGDAGARAAAAAAQRPHGAMVQPFLPEVQAEGEWSLVFIDGAFTHAVLKTPASGDFRVQEEHGGRAAAAQPSAELLAFAGRALSAVETPWLYARVDALRSVTGALLISEIELAEPSLYFTYGPRAAERLAAALKRRLGAR